MMLCEKIKESFGRRRRKLFADYTFFISDKISKIDLEAWQKVNSGNNLFLSPDYLNLLEISEDENYHFRYVIVYEKKTPVAISYFQVIDFSAALFGEMVSGQLSSMQSKRAKLFQTYLEKTKGQVVLRLVTLGNNFVSGEHGVAFAKDISKENQFALINKLSEIISKEEKLHGRISATLVKDFYSNSLPVNNELKEQSFLEFGVEPNMVIELPEKVKSIADYLALFSKKYRNRAKNIFKLSEAIEKRELTAAEIVKLNGKIFALYEQVYNNAKFKLVKLHKNYFVDAKKVFEEKFVVVGFFLDNKLVAFNSAFLLENGELEAHFIGFEYSINKEYELYQNMLYNLVDTAIKNKKQRINLGRTAAEIKSTVGAKAEELTCYVKPQNTVSKMVMSPFLNFLRPSEWVPRNPFKEEMV
ncbi:MAG: hypothetical protein IAF38_05305 [Bacteroidia bacterium]|nr:hypothetical protein [Bacteroidia bacterium]